MGRRKVEDVDVTVLGSIHGDRNYHREFIREWWEVSGPADFRVLDRKTGRVAEFATLEAAREEFAAVSHFIRAQPIHVRRYRILREGR